MPKAMTHLTAEQDLRDRWMEVLITRPQPPSVQNAMLMAAPIVNFVMTGKILGVDHQVDEEPVAVRRTQRPSAR